MWKRAAMTNLFICLYTDKRCRPITCRTSPLLSPGTVIASVVWSDSSQFSVGSFCTKTTQFHKLYSILNNKLFYFSFICIDKRFYWLKGSFNWSAFWWRQSLSSQVESCLNLTADLTAVSVWRIMDFRTIKMTIFFIFLVYQTGTVLAGVAGKKCSIYLVNYESRFLWKQDRLYGLLVC